MKLAPESIFPLENTPKNVFIASMRGYNCIILFARTEIWLHKLQEVDGLSGTYHVTST